MQSSNFMFRGSFPLFLVMVSFLGLFLIAMFTFNSPVSEDNFVWRKPIIGSIFGSICVLGTMAIFFPNECSNVLNFGQKERRWSRFYGFNRGVSVSQSGSSVLRGHHPTCGRFFSHVFRVGDQIFCATCSGLFIAALAALVGVASYFFGNWQTGHSAFSAVWVGILGVILGLLQPLLLTVHRSLVRVFSSALLAIGPFLILVGMDELAHNVFLDVFLVFLTIFWLTTRISLSRWEHEKICSTCSLAFCDLPSEYKKMGV